MTKANKVKKPFYKRVWFWVLAVIVLIAVLPSGDEETTTTVSKPSEEAKDTKKDETATASIGDKLKIGDVVFTVHGKESAESVGDDYVNNTAQGKYLILDISVKNEGKEPLLIDTSFFNIVVGETTFSSDASADLYINDNDLGFFLQEINPGNEARGKVAFDVSDDIIDGKYTLLKVQTGAWGTEQGHINLAK